MRGTYFQGRFPASVNLHFRRFAISSIPLDDEKEFADWLLARWREKDELLQYFVENNRFPADDGVSKTEDGKEIKGAGHIETGVRPVHALEWFQILVPGAALLLVVNVLIKMFGIVVRTMGMR